MDSYGLSLFGGGGSVEWKGSIYAPKLVSFTFRNNCPMAISERTLVEVELRSVVELPQKSKLIAFYPFAVFY